jgi:hypothetical protein
LLDAVDLNLLTEQLADAYLDQTLSNTLEIIFRQQVELIRPPSPEKEQEDRSFFVEEGVPVFDQNSLERALEILLKAIPDNQQFRDPPFLPEEAFDALLRQPYISQQQRIAYRALFDAANEAMLGLFPDFADQQNPSYWLKENRSLRLRPIGTAELRSSITDKLLKWTDYGRKENGNLDKMLAEEIKEDERKWLDFDFERIEAEQLVALMIIEEMFNGEMDRLLTTPI